MDMRPIGQVYYIQKKQLISAAFSVVYGETSFHSAIEIVGKLCYNWTKYLGKHRNPTKTQGNIVSNFYIGEFNSGGLTIQMQYERGIYYEKNNRYVCLHLFIA